MNPSSSRMQRPSARRGRPARPPAAAQTRRSVRRTDVARRGAAPRRVGIAGGWIQRRRPQKKQSRLTKALSGLSGAVSRIGKGRAKPSGMRERGGQVGGVALLTAAAGLALKNRQKVMATLRRDKQGASQAERDTRVGVAPATPPAADVAGQAPVDSPGTAGGNAGPQP